MSFDVERGRPATIGARITNRPVTLIRFRMLGAYRAFSPPTSALPLNLGVAASRQSAANFSPRIWRRSAETPLRFKGSKREGLLREIFPLLRGEGERLSALCWLLLLFSACLLSISNVRAAEKTAAKKPKPGSDATAISAKD